MYKINNIRSINQFYFIHFQIFVYYDVKLSSMLTKSMLTKIREEGELAHLLGEEVVSDKKALRQLVSWCLYGHK